jgi:hypothetical protein
MTKVNAIALLVSTLRNRETTTANAKAQLEQTANRCFVVDTKFLEKGLNIIAKCADVDVETLVSWLAITDKKAAHFIPEKATMKFVRLAQFLGGATNADMVKRGELLDNNLALICEQIKNHFVRGQVGVIKNGVVGASMSLEDMRFAHSYRSANTPDQMEYLISLGRADYHNSTTNTQTSQIKSLFIGLGLATGVKGNGEAIQLTKRFVHAYNYRDNDNKPRHFSYGWNC